jgi:hypothetical protein
LPRFRRVLRHSIPEQRPNQDRAHSTSLSPHAASRHHDELTPADRLSNTAKRIPRSKYGHSSKESHVNAWSVLQLSLDAASYMPLEPYRYQIRTA